MYNKPCIHFDTFGLIFTVVVSYFTLITILQIHFKTELFFIEAC